MTGIRGKSPGLVVAVASLVLIPLVVAMEAIGLWKWDLSIPLSYSTPGHDEIWQLILTKVLVDTGWVLDNPFLGAPDIAHWHYHASAQTSAIHSVIMRGIALFINDAVKVQQVYYLFNFPLIALTSFLACRLLGIAVVPALAAGLLFPFTTYRINSHFYAFLANYFVIPLAVVPVFWILMGEFRAAPAERSTRVGAAWRIPDVLRTRKFIIGLIAVVLVALSDGYYAFFTLLLLGFATVVSAISGDAKKPFTFVVPITYIAVLMGVALVLAAPLRDYKRNHPEEFFPGGVEDPALIKHPFEAEVYVPSLKLLVAPHLDHRVKPLADLGLLMVETSNANRKFEFVPPVALGSLGTILFAIALGLLAIPAFRRAQMFSGSGWAGSTPAHDDRVLWAAVSIALFIFLCSISGGIGTLVALVYPTIRAYDRFPLFLIFVLYIGAGAAVSRLLAPPGAARQRIITAAVGVVCVLALLDQIPKHSAKSDPAVRTLFLAERDFVRRIEAELPAGASVYQYPYSQYLSDSKYYGHGSFSQIRLYLHSKGLRWSNGASQNSPVDNWHRRLSRMPPRLLFSEVQAAGFSAVVIDRAVVSDPEFALLRQTLGEVIEGPLVEDPVAKLAYGRIRNAGYRITYDADFKEITRLEILDRSRMVMKDLPRLVDPVELGRVLSQSDDKAGLVITRAAYPKVFFDSSTATRGMGDRIISPLSDMKGKLSCTTDSQTLAKAARTNALHITLENGSDFDWKLGEARYPIRIGLLIIRKEGKILRWDNGFRVPADLLIPRGASASLRVPVSSIDSKGLPADSGEVVAEFALVQDGHAWFGHIGCQVPIRF